MLAFQRPKRLVCDPETSTDYFGHFYAQPFQRGFGTTVGNALRRILLSSIEGAAVTAVKIEGVLHEFSSIPGVREDVTDILMNLKQLPIRLRVDRPKTLYLEWDGVGEVTAGDIKPDPDVEILDNDLVLATVNETGSLKMEIRVKVGRGYVPADENHDEDLDIGYMPIDSVHSPVRKVNFFVESARLGRSTDYDQMNLQVWTNGCISPKDAVSYSARILRDHLYIFMNFDDKVHRVEGEDDESTMSTNENLNKSVEELELSVRSYNCLKNANIRTIGELVQKTEAEMLRTKNFGRKSLNEIREMLSDMGLSFGMGAEERGRPVVEAEA